MKIVSLRVNGYDIDGLDNASVKITLNNISPVTMTGDSVAFSASIKVPRTPDNDRTFIGLNKGLLNCEYYVAEVLIASIPFKYYAYVSDEPTQFYAKVSASQTEYTINLIESTDKWADISLPISTRPSYRTVQDGSLQISATDISELIRRYVAFPQVTLPAINPEYNTGVDVPDAQYQQASLIVARRDLTWQGDVATGSTKLVPRNYTRGRGGYVYPKIATIAMDNANIYMNANFFGNSALGDPAAFHISAGEDQQFRVIVEYTGDVIPAEKPGIALRGVNSAGVNLLRYNGAISDRVWIYATYADNYVGVSPKADPYMVLAATIDGVTRTDYFKFPDGYAPEEVIRCGEGKIVYSALMAPATQTVYSLPADFPYNDVKKIVGDMCTAWHWRKIYRNGTLRIETIVDANLRDGTSTAFEHVHDWSDKLRSVETVDVPDEFADQYVCTLDATQFSYNNGAGTVTPVKDVYKSGVKFAYERTVFPKVGLTSVFTAPSPSLPYIPVGEIYYGYINRHFKMFRSRIQVKIKAQLEYGDVENLKLGDAYYFSQLNSYFYIKSLGEYDVATGNCKLSLYKMDLK